MVLLYFQNLFGGWNKRICLGIKKDMTNGHKRCGNYTSNTKNHSFCWIHQFQTLGYTNEWFNERYEMFNENWNEFVTLYFSSTTDNTFLPTEKEQEEEKFSEEEFKEFPLYDDEEQAVEDWKQEYLLYREKMKCEGEGNLNNKIEFKGSLSDWRKEFEAYKLKK